MKFPHKFLFFVFFLSAITRFALSFLNSTLLIPTDELLYAKIAQSLIQEGRFAVDGVFPTRVPFMYSLLISSAFFFHNPETTFVVVKLINSLLMSSVVFPVYFLAKRFVENNLAIIASITSVLVGQMMYTSTIMTENFYYPLSILTIFFMYLSFVEGKAFTRLTFGFLLGLCLLTKMSTIGLIASYIAILPIVSLLDTIRTGVRLNFFECAVKTVKTFISLCWQNKLVFIALLGVITPWFFARGQNYGFSVSGLLGDYTEEVVKQPGIDFILHMQWFMIYLGQLAISTGILFLLPASLCAYNFLIDKRRHFYIFGVIAIVVTLTTLVMTSHFSGYNLERLTERHFFFLSPLVFIFFLVWISSNYKFKKMYIPIFLLIFSAIIMSLLLYTIEELRLIDSSALQSFLSAAIHLKIKISHFNIGILIFSILLIAISMVDKKYLVRLSCVMTPLFFIFVSYAEYSEIQFAAKEKTTAFGPKIKWINNQIGLKKNIIVINDYNKKTDEQFFLYGQFFGKHFAEHCNPFDLNCLINFTPYNPEVYGNDVYIVSPFPASRGAELVDQRSGIYLYKRTVGELTGKFQYTFESEDTHRNVGKIIDDIHASDGKAVISGGKKGCVSYDYFELFPGKYVATFVLKGKDLPKGNAIAAFVELNPIGGKKLRKVIRGKEFPADESYFNVALPFEVNEKQKKYGYRIQAIKGSIIVDKMHLEFLGNRS